MNVPPFLTHRVARKKDVLVLRLKARRVAHLLRFDAHDQACVAAAAFVVAHQAFQRRGPVDVLFHADRTHLHITTRRAPGEEAGDTAPSAPASRLLPENVGPLLRLAKPLPADARLEESDIGWLVRTVEEAAGDGWFDEIVKQNEEVLAFLHERQNSKVYLSEMGGKSKIPGAA